MNLKPIALLALLIGAGAPAAAQPPETAPAAHDKLDSVLWVQTAAEHDALYRQAYNAARQMLDRGLKDRKNGRPPSSSNPDTSGSHPPSSST
jgi:predicted secreted acid phosphatase